MTSMISCRQVTEVWSQVAFTRYAIDMTKPTNDQLATLGTAFETFTRRYKLAEAMNAEKPLNEVDKQTLFYVAKNPACGPSDVARFLGIATTTISSATDRLVKRGFLERSRVEGDRRAVALRLSDQGDTYVCTQLKLYREMYRLMLERLSPAERDHFIAMITKIVYTDD
jgi:DNA-binding MarR family transcriptional regulator